jgi:vacuolar protein sorting-associated protein 35
MAPPHLAASQDEDNLREALRYSAAMLGELRTSFLSPQKYYELYMQVFDELGNLEVGPNSRRKHSSCSCDGVAVTYVCTCKPARARTPQAYFADEQSKGRTLAELYELVQHAGNVLPRLYVYHHDALHALVLYLSSALLPIAIALGSQLPWGILTPHAWLLNPLPTSPLLAHRYLMVAVGCLYIRGGAPRPAEVLRDLVEMSKGVQHPTRGLFLRSYLCQRSRALMPGAAEGGPGCGDVHDAVDFLLTNFVEMNKLWVRMQHQGGPRDRERRERERAQLQVRVVVRTYILTHTHTHMHTCTYAQPPAAS